MNNLPGFNAEASVYKTTGCYLMGGNSSRSTTTLIEPQLKVGIEIPDGIANGAIFGGAIGGTIGTIVGGGLGTGVGAAIGAAIGGFVCWLCDCCD
jgi:hypothetical protein